MGLILVPAFLVYGVLVLAIGIPAILGAGFERAGIPAEAAAKGPRRLASIGAFVLAVLVHAGVQIVPAVVSGGYYAFTIVLTAWFGIPSLLAFVTAIALLVVGRRQKNPVLLAASQRVWVAMFLFVVLPIPEISVLDALGVEAEY
jgi:hypothetical protein